MKMNVDHMKNYNHYIPFTTVPMTAKFGRVVTYLNKLLLLLSPDPLITCSCWITWQSKNMSTTTVPMATKVMAYYEELQLIMLLDPTIMWFCEITWHTKCFISLLAIDQWLPNMVRWWLTERGFPFKHVYMRVHVTN